MTGLSHPSISKPPCKVRGAFIFFLLVSVRAQAQAPETAGDATIGLQFFRQSPAEFGGSDLGGIRVNLRQLLPQGGMFSLTANSVLGSGALLWGPSFLEFRDLPLGNSRTSLTAGTVYTPLDSMDRHFSNLINPSFYLMGGEVQVNYSKIKLAAIGGRNQLFLGPGILYLKAAPDSLVAFQVVYQPSKKLKTQFRTLVTRARTPVEFLGLPAEEVAFRMPRRSQVGLWNVQYEWMKGFYWLGEVGVSRSTPQPALSSLSPSGTELSFFTGPLVQTDRYHFEANYARQSADYFPLSNLLLGDRQGPFLAGDYRVSQRVSVFASFAGTRNNIENNPHRPTLEGNVLNAGSALRLPSRFNLTLSGSRNTLTLKTSASGRTETLFHNYLAQVQRPLHGLLPAYRFQQMDLSSPLPAGQPKTRIRSHEFELQKAFRNGSSILGATRVQQSSSNVQNATTFFGRAGGSLSVRNRLSFYGQGEVGRDLSNETLFALNTLKTVSAGLQFRLPRGYALRGQMTFNSFRTLPNLENLFFASSVLGAPVLPMVSLARRTFYLELTKSFNWGRGQLAPEGLPTEFLSRYIPTYGDVEGYAFHDRNQNGERDPGEEGLPGVIVVLGDRTTQTDASGHFRFEQVRTGFYQLQVPPDRIPANYSVPSQTQWAIEVQQKGTAISGIPLQVLSTLRGQVTVLDASGRLLPFANARVTLKPSGQATLTDDEGIFSFDNLPTGLYVVELEFQGLPEGAQSLGPNSITVRVPGGAVVGPINFSFKVVPVERPIQRVPLGGSSRIILPSSGEIPSRRAKAPQLPMQEGTSPISQASKPTP